MADHARAGDPLDEASFEIGWLRPKHVSVSAKTFTPELSEAARCLLSKLWRARRQLLAISAWRLEKLFRRDAAVRIMQ
jgi:hypothetical protein